MPDQPKPFTDQDATEADWLLLDLLRGLVFEGEKILPSPRPDKSNTLINK